jgi:hypothetical protein
MPPIPLLQATLGLTFFLAPAISQQPLPLAPVNPASLPTVVVGDGRPGVTEAWMEFQRQNPGPWRALWCTATGTPHAIYGTGLPLADWRGNSLEEARRHALLLLQNRADLLGLGTSEFRESIGARMGRTWSFKFDQYFRGLPVIDGRADVRVNMAGRIAMFGSRAWPIPADFATVPTLGEAAATLIAWRAVGTTVAARALPSTPREPRLVVFGNVMAAQRTTPVLAWEIAIHAVAQDGTGPAGRYYIDAANGRVLEFRSDRHECGVPGCTAGSCEAATAALTTATAAAAPAVPEPVAIPNPDSALPITRVRIMAYTQVDTSAAAAPQLVPMPFMDVDIGGFPHVTDANGEIFPLVNQSMPVTARFDGPFLGGVSGPNGGTVTGTIDPNTTLTLTFFSPNASSQQLAHSNTFYWMNRSNRFLHDVLGNTPQLTWLNSLPGIVNSPGSCNARFTGTDIEFYLSNPTCRNTAFSSVIAHEWGHAVDYAYGTIHGWNGLGEAYADIVANYLLDDPVLGRDFLTVAPFNVRSSVNSLQYPNGASQHEQAQSFAGFAWRFRDLLESYYWPLSRSYAISLSNSIVLGSLAADAMTQPEAVLEVCIADDNDGNLANGTPHTYVLQLAAAAHSLPMPWDLPPNDTCATALTLVEGLNGPFHNQYASVEQTWYVPRIDPQRERTGVADLWFRYTTGVAGTLTVSLCGRAGFDTVMALYSGANCNSMTEIALDDNFCGSASRISHSVNPGTYWIRVASGSTWNGWTYPYSVGQFHIEVNGPGGGAAFGYYGNPCVGNLPVTAPLIYGELPRFGTTVPIVTTPWPSPMMIGFQAIGFVPYVPGIPLGPLGAPGCEQLVAPLTTELLFAPNGVSVYNLAIPHAAGLQGLGLHAQTFLLAPGANALGVITSDGLGLTIGS